METVLDFDLEQVGQGLVQIMHECGMRGLQSSATWAAELLHALYKGNPKFRVTADHVSQHISTKEYSKYVLAKMHFHAEEYDRAAYFCQTCTSPLARFFHFYSLYRAGERDVLDCTADISMFINKSRIEDLKSLRGQFEKLYRNNGLDGFCLYLYGVVLKKLQLDKQALEILCESIHMEPLNWGSWYELAALIVDREMLNDLILPDHWIKNFFLAHTYLELQMNELALEIYTKLIDMGFSHSTYVMGQVAVAYHNMRDLDKAIGGFQDLLKVDPFRLESLDIYSNLLYVKEMRVELSDLAHKACNVDKYRVETCCVIGNFYSLRTQHEKAVMYFHRALQLNPNYLSAWTLMGHEYMEMKNTSFAIHAYRQAIEVNRRDYRAWYGLGQTYELLKMFYYCLYYYKQAQLLRPHDSRMMVALGEAYEKLEKYEEAKRCFWKAHAVGDVEGLALMKLGKVYEKMNEDDQAAAAFTDYIRDAQNRGATDRDEVCFAYLALAKYYYKRLCLDKAEENAEHCLEYPEVVEDGKTILRQIASRRLLMEQRNEAEVRVHNIQILLKHL